MKDSRFLPLPLLILFALCCVAGFCRAEETNAAAVPAGLTNEAAASNQAALRSSLEVQDQLHSLQQADEKFRRESADALAELKQQLLQVQSSVAAQKVNDLQDLHDAYIKAQDTNSAILRAAIAFAVFGCVVLAVAAYLQWNMAGRMRTLAANSPGLKALETGHTPAALGMGETALLASQGLERSTAQFLSAMERLEARIRDMEAEATAGRLHRTLEAGGAGHEARVLTNGSDAGNAGENGTHPTAEADDKFSLLLSKGQTLLKLDKAEEALVCFDEALGARPGHAEALLARGLALERLQRLDEAIECYDRAIASDSSMTMAYLHKGGVFNRMERYSEALECYEQALKSQDKERVVVEAA